MLAVGGVCQESRMCRGSCGSSARLCVNLVTINTNTLLSPTASHYGAEPSTRAPLLYGSLTLHPGRIHQTELKLSVHLIGTFLTFDPGPLAPYPTWFIFLSLEGLHRSRLAIFILRRPPGQAPVIFVPPVASAGSRAQRFLLCHYHISQFVSYWYGS